jgi:hypothetical protein
MDDNHFNDDPLNWEGEDDEVFMPPLPTQAARIPSLKSISSIRGTLLNGTTNTEIVFESGLERGFALDALADPANATLQEQPAPVKYMLDGAMHTHVFDFLLVRKTGLRVAVDVKPSKRVGPSGIDTVQALIRKQVGKTFADEYIVVTEEDIHPDSVEDARLILRARRMSDPEADTAVKPYLPAHGTTPISDIVAATGLEARAFNAIVRAIDGGIIAVVGDDKIDYGTMVTASPSAPTDGDNHG